MASTAIPAPAPKVSWLAHIGSILGKILGFVGKEAPTIAATASGVAKILLPQFAPEIGVADNIVSNIAKEAVAAEGVMAAAGTATGTGAQKLATVLANVGPMIDTWVSSSFPGSTAVSAANKAGLVNAVVGILNEVGTGTGTSVPSPTPAAPAV